MENQTIDKNQSERDVKEVKAPEPIPYIEPTELISFDAYFHLLCARENSVMAHHKIPVQRFMENFGDINAQTLAWFDELYKKY